MGCFPPEVNDHLICLAGVELKLVLLTPAENVPDDHPVFQVVPLRNTTNNGCVVRELLDVAVGGVVCEVRGVEGEKEGGEHHTLRGICAVEHHVRHTVTDDYN